MGDHRFVFVCGLQRSGTTMLYRYLDEHPQVSALSGTARATNEGQFVQTVYPSDPYHSKGGRFAFRSEARLTEASPLVTAANRRKLFEEWSRYWDLSKPYLVEKSPPNLIRTRFLQAMFPQSYFVVLLRHPIPVTLATQPWGGDPVHRLLEHWLRAHELLVEDAAHLERLHVLRYEDLVGDPDATLARVFAFLGLEDPSSGRPRAEGVNVDNFLADRTLRTDVNEKYFAEWSRRRRPLARRLYYDALAWRYERQVQAFGYSLREPRSSRAGTVGLPGLVAAERPRQVA
ncbi:MAG: sulfotransferase [Actinomycetota bacterium]|nr:sulfotransferase [Actinomycetota bacterium]